MHLHRNLWQWHLLLRLYAHSALNGISVSAITTNAFMYFYLLAGDYDMLKLNMLISLQLR